MTKSNSYIAKFSWTLMTIAALLFLLYMGFQFGVWLKG